MNAIKLFRILQNYVGLLNKIAVDLYNGEIEADAAETQAKALIGQLTAAMNEE